MNQILGFILGLAVGGVAVFFIVRQRDKKDGKEKEGDLDKTQFEKKEENIKKILDFMAGKEKVTNNDVEKFLKVSDSTATRYLDELEKQGKIRQVGKSGHYTHYEKI